MSAPHEILAELVQKPSRIVCGIMSGTSVDGVDVALLRVTGHGPETKAELLHYFERPFPEDVQQLILNNTEVSTSTISDICVLRTLLAQIYAEAVQDCCAEAGMDSGDIDIIGVHGQTLFHMPEPLDIGGYSIRSTLQAVNGPALANELGVPVVSDFRSADMALGGQGAPLVPYVDYMLFHSDTTNRAMVNIGGIANITWLPQHGTENDILAYDAGPGNMVVNALTRYFFGMEYDEDGRIARRGRLNQDLYGWMMAHPYFNRKPPKTTGREMFGVAYIEQLLEMAEDFDITDPDDVVATASQMTVSCIATEIQSVAEQIESYSVYLCGGGSKNLFFYEGLKHALGPGVVHTSDEIGINTDAKEAHCFAILANEWLHGGRANVPAVTGASQKALLGTVSMP